MFLKGHLREKVKYIKVTIYMAVKHAMRYCLPLVLVKKNRAISSQLVSAPPTLHTLMATNAIQPIFIINETGFKTMNKHVTIYEHTFFIIYISMNEKE